MMMPQHKLEAFMQDLARLTSLRGTVVSSETTFEGARLLGIEEGAGHPRSPDPHFLIMAQGSMMRTAIPIEDVKRVEVTVEP